MLMGSTVFSEKLCVWRKGCLFSDKGVVKKKTVHLQSLMC